ncbi:MAG: prepilin peptidase [Candidatus Pacearchaeota archaeon]
MATEIFLLVLVFIFIASLQDFKRREIDVWLNLFVFFIGFIYLIFKSFSYKEISYLTNFSFLLIFVFFLANIIYKAKIFAGGDCTLLFCLSPFFVSIDFFKSFENFFFFLFALFFLGAIYGFFWSFSLFLKKIRVVKEKIYSKKNYFLILIFIFFLIFGFFVKEFIFILLICVILFFSYLFLYLEKELFAKEILTKDLKEGDWLENDIKIGDRIIKSNFDGLSKEEISFLKKRLEKIRIKDGIPYAFAFFLAWASFYFKDFIMEFLVSILVT